MEQSVFGSPILPTQESRGLITLKEINDYFSTYNPPSSSPQEEITNQEFNIIQNNPICPSVRSAINSGYDPRRVDTKGYADLVRDEFYNPEVMRTAACVADGIAYIADQTGKYDQMRQWLKDLSVIGDVSANGIAMSASTGIDKRVVIAKISIGGKEDLIHELFVGINMNSMRQWIPSFMITLAGFKCSPPIVAMGTEGTQQPKQVITYCEAKNKVNYILLEYINPSISLSEFSRTATASDWLCQFYQVELALRAAVLTNEFTHNDLHSKNVYLRTLGSPVVIPFPATQNTPQSLQSNGMINIKSDKVATIIDYGAAHIRVNGTNYGNAGLSKYGVKYNRPFPMYDSYKLLLSCALDAQRYNNTEVFAICEKIFKFFNITDSLATVLADLKYLYSLPPLVKLVNIPHDNLISFIDTNLKEYLTFIVTPGPQDKIINCNATTCTTPEQIDEKMGIYNTQPISLFDTPLSATDKLRLEPAHRRQYEALISTFSSSIPENKLWVPMSNPGYKHQVDNAVGSLDLLLQIKKYADAGASATGMNTSEGNSEYYTNTYYNLISSTEDYILSLTNVLEQDMTKLATKISGLTKVIDNGVLYYVNSQGNKVDDPELALYSPMQVSAILDFARSVKKMLFVGE